MIVQGDGFALFEVTGKDRSIVLEKIHGKIEKSLKGGNMDVHKLTQFLGYMTSALDDGCLDSISVQDVLNNIDSGNLYSFLDGKFDGNLSKLMHLSKSEISYLEDLYSNMRSVYSTTSRIRKKQQVEKKGLALLLSWGLEIIFEKYGKQQI